MNTKKQNADFLHVGRKLLAWYKIHGRDLPFRKTSDPYKIWICEIIFQQTRIEQGLGHYNKFVERFPSVEVLANAHVDDVLLHWKGLGYYSRALNIHKAANQIITEYNGIFPNDYNDILSLKGIGKYTAAAISSICFGKNVPAVDGNFYRVLSRLYADDFDVSTSQAFSYFSELALQMMPPLEAGSFNEAMMDLGSAICKPKNPNCNDCPLNEDCLAYASGKFQDYPRKTKKTRPTDLNMKYTFVEHDGNFLVRQRGEDFIWKKLFEFPVEMPADLNQYLISQKTVSHKLTHKNLMIEFSHVKLPSPKMLLDFAEKGGFLILDSEEAVQKSFPKPLENFLVTVFDK